MQDLPQNNKNELSLSKDYIASSNLRDKDKEIVAFYGNNFLQDVCPQFPTKNREACYPSLESAVEDDAAPSLVSIDNIYGQGASEMWLSVQLLEVLMFTGLRDKMTPEQRNALARQLRKMGYHVKMGEFCQFFTRFEQGYYKTFKGYERPNPQVITESFNIFLEELLEMRGVYQAKRIKEQEEADRASWDKTAVPCPEHIRKKLERLYQKTDTNVQLSKKKSEH